MTHTVAPAESAPQAGPFVSYAREDRAFVRRLHEALEHRQRDTWVDWEGIYPTEEWMARIRAAIDAAPAFVFVISPDSVASRVCAEEIDHAVRQHKRIIPIVSREVDAAAVHPEVAKLNWLPFHQSVDFDTEVEGLIAAMDLDIDWLRTHTRLLVRAEEWQKRERDGSVLLRGADLRGAEGWLLSADAASKRTATPLQSQFIVASRQAETRRRNVQRTIAGVALVVLSLLSIYSWIQKTTAERQRNLAISRQVAARAAAIPAEEPLARVLVSALATRYSHTAEADAALARALLPTVPLERMLWSGLREASMDCLAFHRDGGFIAGSNGRAVTVWQTATGQAAASFLHDDGVDCVAFGPRSDLLAIADEGRVILWEWPQDRRRVLGAAPNQATTRVAFSDDGRSVFAASKGRISRWDIESGRSQEVISPPAEDLDYAFSPDGSRAASVDPQGTIAVWQLDTATPVAQFQGPRGGARRVALSPGGRFVASGGDAIVLWEVTGEGLPTGVELGTGIATALAFNAKGDRLAATAADGSIRQWDVAQRRERLPLPGPRFAAAVAFSPDGTQLATGGDLGAVHLWKPSRQNTHILQRQPDVELQGEESAADGTMLGLKRGRGFVLWHPAGAREPVDLVDFPTRHNWPQVSARATTLGVIDGQGEIALWDARTGQAMRRIAPPGVSIERIDIDAAGTRVAGVGIGGEVVVADTQGTIVWSKDADATGHVRSAAFSPDASRLATGGLSGAVHLWTAATGEHLFALENGRGNVLGLAFTPDGRQLAATTGAAIAIWDLDARAVRRTLRGHTGPVTSVAFSPDASLLVSGSLDRTAIVWNPISGDELFKIDSTVSIGDVIAVSFAGDGKTLATRARSGTVRLWDMDGAGWTELACSLVNRNLTPEEWETYLPSEPYRAACPGLPSPPARGR